MPPRNPQPADRAAARIAGECLATRVRLLNRTITGIYDEKLRPLGLTAGQLNVLAMIAGRSPVSPGDVARRLNMEKSTVSRTVGRMHRNGWLDVTRGDAGRSQALTVTREGLALIEASVPSWEEAQVRARALLGPRGADSIHRIGNRVWSRLHLLEGGKQP